MDILSCGAAAFSVVSSGGPAEGEEQVNSSGCPFASAHKQKDGENDEALKKASCPFAVCQILKIPSS